eukprot:Tamp_27865.p1 GENE.Tamp_27865~~Tamp_27865.p1  ORF type:complete len:226 (+),score=29.00 Tamp_27865:73-750(+)
MPRSPGSPAAARRGSLAAAAGAGSAPSSPSITATGERLVDSATAREGELVKIAASARSHWACRKFVGLVGRLSGADEYAGWWVEFPGHAKALFHCADSGSQQLAYAGDADIAQADGVVLSHQALEEAHEKDARAALTLPGDTALSPRAAELQRLHKDVTVLKQAKERIYEQLTAAWGENATLRVEVQLLHEQATLAKLSLRQAQGAVAFVGVVGACILVLALRRR